MDPLIAKLSFHSDLTRDSRIAIETLARSNVRHVKPRHNLYRAGERPRSGYMVLEGWAVRHKSLTDGRRQMTAVLLPGDVFDLHAYLATQTDDSVAAITPLSVAALSNDDFEDLTDAHPSLTKAFLWEQLVETAIEREWVLNVGQRDGRERVAHLLCEIIVRLRIVGLTEGNRCAFPLTQADIAEMTGLTSVHVNRVMQALRADGLIVTFQRSLTVPDLPRLMKLALFDPQYLHLEGNESFLTAA